MPFPVKGNTYTTLEATEWLRMDKNASSISKSVQMIDQKKYVPIGKSTLYTIFKKCKLTGYFPNEWHLEGRHNYDYDFFQFKDCRHL